MVGKGSARLRESAESFCRLAGDLSSCEGGLHSPASSKALRQVVKPKSPVGTMRKVGIALIACPDPISGIPGAALVASSYVMKKKEPVGVGQLAVETNKILRELSSFRL
ncbi:MAG TPA: hypothetical protein VEJ36_06965 [Nitrososphaerales archaeon]|nr:hypothetical protein [Nitrososphaerales archaeon]